MGMVKRATRVRREKAHNMLEKKRALRASRAARVLLQECGLAQHQEREARSSQPASPPAPRARSPDGLPHHANVAAPACWEEPVDEICNALLEMSSTDSSALGQGLGGGPPHAEVAISAERHVEDLCGVLLCLQQDAPTAAVTSDRKRRRAEESEQQKQESLAERQLEQAIASEYETTPSKGKRKRMISQKGKSFYGAVFQRRNKFPQGDMEARTSDLPMAAERSEEGGAGGRAAEEVCIVGSAGAAPEMREATAHAPEVNPAHRPVDPAGGGREEASHGRALKPEEEEARGAGRDGAEAEGQGGVGAFRERIPMMMSSEPRQDAKCDEEDPKS